MKINFTKKEYAALLDLIHLGDWVLHSHVVREENQSKPHAEVRNKINSYYKDMDATDKIEHWPGTDEYHETNEYGQAIYEDYVSPYNAMCFWEELIDRLTSRDMLEKYGQDALKNMSTEERMEAEQPFLEYYHEQFENGEIKNLRIAKLN